MITVFEDVLKALEQNIGEGKRHKHMGDFWHDIEDMGLFSGLAIKKPLFTAYVGVPASELMELKRTLPSTFILSEFKSSGADVANYIRENTGTLFNIESRPKPPAGHITKPEKRPGEKLRENIEADAFKVIQAHTIGAINKFGHHALAKEVAQIAMTNFKKFLEDMPK
jgi:hypothetical protein